MGNSMNISALTGILLSSLILLQGDPGVARQNIRPAEPALQQMQPADPSGGVVIRVSHNTATLSWQPADDSRVVGYEVWKGTIPDMLTGKKVGNVTTYTIDNLAQGQTWYFRVSSYDAKGNRSELSEMVSKIIGKLKGSH